MSTFVAFDAAQNYPTTDAGTSAPMTAAASTAFGGQLGNASAALAAGAVQWRPSTSIGVNNSTESARVGQGNRNAPLGTGPAALLSAHAEPNADAVSNDLDVTHVADTAELTNSTVAGPMRFVTAGETFELPGVHHVPFIKKHFAYTQRYRDSKKHPRILAPPSFDGTSVNPGMIADGRGPQPYQRADMSMQVAQHVYALNELLCRKQWELFKTNIRRYRELQPQDILRGVEDLEDWTGWMSEGSVIHESLLDGGSSQFNDGYMSNRMRNMLRLGSAASRPSNQAKKITTTRSGRARIADVFGGRGINVGSAQYMIVTKKPEKIYSGKMAYTLSTKAGPYSPGNGSGIVMRTHTFGSLEDQKKMGKDADVEPMYASLQHGFTPFQIFFLSVPDGGSPLVAFKEWKDEWGHMHYNAHCCLYSRLIFEPYQYERLPAITDPADDAFQPATNGSEALNRKLIEGVLLVPCQDGWRDMV